MEDVTVADLTVTSTYDGALGSDTEDEDAGGGPMFGVFVGSQDGRGSRRVLVERVRVERFQRHGISVKASREVTVRGCEVRDATSVGPGGAGYGIAVEGLADRRDPAAADDSRHHVVVDDVLHGHHLRHAILLQFPTHHNLAARNVVRRSRLDAIDLHGEGEYGNEVRENVVVDGERAGIALGNSGGTTHRHGASGEGNWIHDNVLVGNRVGVLVILGTPGTVVERNRVVADRPAP
ncbi:right-handed parallel beta-helix repeat-containing protein [Nocardioides solisilvae]|uniref:right-handed parallel beta-helix repeat-containing protein n=1 Tax=Nocardioides solisilvae TaxID=1542435 RepID=UPI0013A530D6|nr:right-handed parallel beta-helix repeat-containing protein [Nocardioides solisilvae]